ncbi:hypothetical protein TrVFT333_002961 [Trichoderma virens FT-333]|nr:hypothetical protein TrVFT333_002961 [Trichoderma virens FT-333]
MTSNSPSSDSSYVCDDWPKMPDGTDYDRKQLLDLVLSGKSPFSDVWDVKQLIKEIEEHLDTKIVDIPYVHDGANCYGFHCKLSNQSDIVARLARSDINMPNFDGFPLDLQTCDVQFEAALYELLRSFTDIKASNLLYWRLPVQHPGPKQDLPRDILGRRLMVFERANGDTNIWKDLSESEQSSLLAQFAHIRASLFNFQISPEFATTWFLKHGNASPSVSYWNEAEDPMTPEELVRYTLWAKAYCEVLFREAPDYERAIRAGNDARHLWFALRGWKGDDPEDFFGDLGNWAEKRMKELGVNQEEA